MYWYSQPDPWKVNPDEPAYLPGRGVDEKIRAAQAKQAELLAQAQAKEQQQGRQHDHDAELEM